MTRVNWAMELHHLIFLTDPVEEVLPPPTPPDTISDLLQLQVGQIPVAVVPGLLSGMVATATCLLRYRNRQRMKTANDTSRKQPHHLKSRSNLSNHASEASKQSSFPVRMIELILTPLVHNPLSRWLWKAETTKTQAHGATPKPSDTVQRCYSTLSIKSCASCLDNIQSPKCSVQDLKSEKDEGECRSKDSEENRKPCATVDTTSADSSTPTTDGGSSRLENEPLHTFAPLAEHRLSTYSSDTPPQESIRRGRGRRPGAHREKDNDVQKHDTDACFPLGHGRRRSIFSKLRPETPDRMLIGVETTQTSKDSEQYMGNDASRTVDSETHERCNEESTRYSTREADGIAHMSIHGKPTGFEEKIGESFLTAGNLATTIKENWGSVGGVNSSQPSQPPNGVMANILYRTGRSSPDYFPLAPLSSRAHPRSSNKHKPLPVSKGALHKKARRRKKALESRKSKKALQYTAAFLEKKTPPEPTQDRKCLSRRLSMPCHVKEGNCHRVSTHLRDVSAVLHATTGTDHVEKIRMIESLTTTSCTTPSYSSHCSITPLCEINLTGSQIPREQMLQQSKNFLQISEPYTTLSSNTIKTKPHMAAVANNMKNRFIDDALSVIHISTSNHKSYADEKQDLTKIPLTPSGHWMPGSNRMNEIISQRIVSHWHPPRTISTTDQSSPTRMSLIQQNNQYLSETFVSTPMPTPSLLCTDELIGVKYLNKMNSQNPGNKTVETQEISQDVALDEAALRLHKNEQSCYKSLDQVHKGAVSTDAADRKYPPRPSPKRSSCLKDARMAKKQDSQPRDNHVFNKELGFLHFLAKRESANMLPTEHDFKIVNSRESEKDTGAQELITNKRETRVNTDRKPGTQITKRHINKRDGGNTRKSNLPTGRFPHSANRKNNEPGTSSRWKMDRQSGGTKKDAAHTKNSQVTYSMGDISGWTSGDSVMVDGTDPQYINQANLNDSTSGLEHYVRKESLSHMTPRQNTSVTKFSETQKTKLPVRCQGLPSSTTKSRLHPKSPFEPAHPDAKLQSNESAHTGSPMGTATTATPRGGNNKGKNSPGAKAPLQASPGRCGTKEGRALKKEVSESNETSKWGSSPEATSPPASKRSIGLSQILKKSPSSPCRSNIGDASVSASSRKTSTFQIKNTLPFLCGFSDVGLKSERDESPGLSEKSGAKTHALKTEIKGCREVTERKSRIPVFRPNVERSEHNRGMQMWEYTKGKARTHVQRQEKSETNASSRQKGSNLKPILGMPAKQAKCKASNTRGRITPKVKSKGKSNKQKVSNVVTTSDGEDGTLKTGSKKGVTSSKLSTTRGAESRQRLGLGSKASPDKPRQKVHEKKNGKQVCSHCQSAGKTSPPQLKSKILIGADVSTEDRKMSVIHEDEDEDEKDVELKAGSSKTNFDNPNAPLTVGKEQRICMKDYLGMNSINIEEIEDVDMHSYKRSNSEKTIKELLLYKAKKILRLKSESNLPYSNKQALVSRTSVPEENCKLNTQTAPSVDVSQEEQTNVVVSASVERNEQSKGSLTGSVASKTKSVDKQQCRKLTVLSQSRCSSLNSCNQGSRSISLEKCNTTDRKPTVEKCTTTDRKPTVEKCTTTDRKPTVEGIVSERRKKNDYPRPWRRQSKIPRSSSDPKADSSKLQDNHGPAKPVFTTCDIHTPLDCQSINNVEVSFAGETKELLGGRESFEIPTDTAETQCNQASAFFPPIVERRSLLCAPQKIFALGEYMMWKMCEDYLIKSVDNLKSQEQSPAGGQTSGACLVELSESDGISALGKDPRAEEQTRSTDQQITDSNSRRNTSDLNSRKNSSDPDSRRNTSDLNSRRNTSDLNSRRNASDFKTQSTSGVKGTLNLEGREKSGDSTVGTSTHSHFKKNSDSSARQNTSAKARESNVSSKSDKLSNENSTEKRPKQEQLTSTNTAPTNIGDSQIMEDSSQNMGCISSKEKDPQTRPNQRLGSPNVEAMARERRRHWNPLSTILPANIYLSTVGLSAMFSEIEIPQEEGYSLEPLEQEVGQSPPSVPHYPSPTQIQREEIEQKCSFLTEHLENKEPATNVEKDLHETELERDRNASDTRKDVSKSDSEKSKPASEFAKHVSVAVENELSIHEDKIVSIEEIGKTVHAPVSTENIELPSDIQNVDPYENAANADADLESLLDSELHRGRKSGHSTRNVSLFKSTESKHKIRKARIHRSHSHSETGSRENILDRQVVPDSKHSDCQQSVTSSRQDSPPRGYRVLASLKRPRHRPTSSRHVNDGKISRDSTVLNKKAARHLGSPPMKEDNSLYNSGIGRLLSDYSECSSLGTNTSEYLQCDSKRCLHEVLHKTKRSRRVSQSETRAKIPSTDTITLLSSLTSVSVVSALVESAGDISTASTATYSLGGRKKHCGHIGNRYHLENTKARLDGRRAVHGTRRESVKTKGKSETLPREEYDKAREKEPLKGPTLTNVQTRLESIKRKYRTQACGIEVPKDTGFQPGKIEETKEIILDGSRAHSRENKKTTLNEKMSAVCSMTKTDGACAQLSPASSATSHDPGPMPSVYRAVPKVPVENKKITLNDKTSAVCSITKTDGTCAQLPPASSVTSHGLGPVSSVYRAVPKVPLENKKTTLNDKMSAVCSMTKTDGTCAQLSPASSVTSHGLGPVPGVYRAVPKVPIPGRYDKEPSRSSSEVVVSWVGSDSDIERLEDVKTFPVFEKTKPCEERGPHSSVAYPPSRDHLGDAAKRQHELKRFSLEHLQNGQKGTKSRNSSPNSPDDPLSGNSSSHVISSSYIGDNIVDFVMSACDEKEPNDSLETMLRSVASVDKPKKGKDKKTTEEVFTFKSRSTARQSDHYTQPRRKTQSSIVLPKSTPRGNYKKTPTGEFETRSDTKLRKHKLDVTSSKKPIGPFKAQGDKVLPHPRPHRVNHLKTSETRSRPLSGGSITAKTNYKQQQQQPNDGQSALPRYSLESHIRSTETNSRILGKGFDSNDIGARRFDHLSRRQVDPSVPYQTTEVEGAEAAHSRTMSPSLEAHLATSSNDPELLSKSTSSQLSLNWYKPQSTTSMTSVHTAPNCSPESQDKTRSASAEHIATNQFPTTNNDASHQGDQLTRTSNDAVHHGDQLTATRSNSLHQKDELTISSGDAMHQKNELTAISNDAIRQRDQPNETPFQEAVKQDQSDSTPSRHLGCASVMESTVRSRLLTYESKVRGETQDSENHQMLTTRVRARNRFRHESDHHFTVPQLNESTPPHTPSPRDGNGDRWFRSRSRSARNSQQDGSSTGRDRRTTQRTQFSREADSQSVTTRRADHQPSLASRREQVQEERECSSRGRGTSRRLPSVTDQPASEIPSLRHFIDPTVTESRSRRRLQEPEKLKVTKMVEMFEKFNAQ